MRCPLFDGRRALYKYSSTTQPKKRPSHFFFFFFFFSCLTSMCNPVGYDRLKHLYIQNSSLAWRPLAVHFCAVSPRLIHDIWELIKFLFSLLTPIQFIQASLNHPAALPPPDHSSAPILFPVPLPHLFYLLRSILGILISDRSPFR